ncbi:MAG: outer membrane lipoprotein carrier protein LolA [Bacteroidales bacterium]|nr:outer membrane lipoprotein carrier protein LolA [Bacteroidales bacterium]
MKKHIPFIVGIILLMASSSLFAQSNSDAIKKLAQTIRSHKNMEVKFTYQTISGASKPEEAKEGKAYFQDKAYKVILEDQHAISDGKTTWQYIIEDEEVMVGNATDDDNPFKILDNLERDDSGITADIDKKGNLKKLEIIVDEDAKLILNITEMKFDQQYSKGFFTFDKKAYPNVEIIDMR